MINYHLSIKSLEKYHVIKTDEISQVQQEPSISYGEYVEPKIHPLILLSLLQVNPYHASACSIKANDILRTGYTIENDNGRVDEFIQACKPSFEFIMLRALEDLQVFNYCALEVVRDSTGEPVRLEYIPAHTIRVHKNLTRYMHTWDNVNITYFKDYQYDGEIDPETGEDTEAIGANEIIFIHLPNPMCSYYGVPRYISAAPAILSMQKIDEYNYAFFDNFTIPSYVITVTGEFEDEEILDSEGNPTGKTVLQELIEENFSYIRENPHTPLVLSVPGGDSVEVKFTPLNTTQQDASFQNYIDSKKLDIAAAHMIDPYRLGIFETGPLGGNFAEVTRKTYHESVIRPQQNIIQSILTDFFQEKFGADIIFNFKDEVLLESELVLNYVRLVEAGVITPAEARKQLFGWDGGLDSFYLPGQYMPYSSSEEMSMKTRPTNQNNYKKLLRNEYNSMRNQIKKVINSDLQTDEKKRQIDMILTEFKNIGEMKIREALPSAYETGRLKSGMPTLIASSPAQDRYIEMQLTGLNDFIEKVRYYLYKIILSQGS